MASRKRWRVVATEFRGITGANRILFGVTACIERAMPDSKRNGLPLSGPICCQVFSDAGITRSMAGRWQMLGGGGKNALGTLGSVA
jgi:hypothetical protein